VKVFVAGASGVVGRQLVPALLGAGHDVTGMTRSEAAAEPICAAGGPAAVCDDYDTAALGRAVAEAGAEVLVHELTALPEAIDPRRQETYEATNRIRTEGTRNLLAAAAAAGVRRVVAQSCGFVYAPQGDWVKAENAPVLSGVPGAFGSALAAILDLERQVLGAQGMEGLVLRYGFFYGPGSAYAGDGYYAGEARRRRLPVVGPGTGTFSFIHVEDAAAATVAAVERGSRGVYNIADDEPARMSDWVPVYAEAVGAKPPRKVPRWLATLVAGRSTADMATTLRGASNAKAKAELGWRPRYPSWRQGFREALG
jgi:nucleoside-diphosphate-sugar epimerase